MKIKNWKSFQHFKDRRPPWIKLHREVLDQRDISLISDCSFRVLVGLWLIASEDKDLEGKLPSIDDIAFKLRMDKSKVNKSLKELGAFLIHDDDSMISDGYQVDDPEKRRVETEKNSMSGNKPDIAKFKKDAKVILLFLNEKAGRGYEPVDANLSFIIARFKEGATTDQFRQIIVRKVREWSGDETMNKFLRPKTLFSKTNFAQYVGELGT